MPLVAGAVTVTMAVALLLESAWLMATTLWFPGEVPAVYKPLVEIVPTLALPPDDAVHRPADGGVGGVRHRRCELLRLTCGESRKVGDMETETGAGAEEEETVMVVVLLKTAPLESQAFTQM